MVELKMSHKDSNWRSESERGELIENIVVSEANEGKNTHLIYNGDIYTYGKSRFSSW